MIADDEQRDGGAKLEDFLHAPREEVARVAPVSMIYSVSGTRRGAALAGKLGDGGEYVRWSRAQMMDCLDIIFGSGVRHVIMPVLTPSQFMEATPAYREFLWEWLNEGLAGKEAMADYGRRGWQVRLPFAEALPRLQDAGRRLSRETKGEGGRLWIFLAPHHNFFWEQALTSGVLETVQGVEEAIRLLYGDDIAPATLFLDFGKPVISPDLLPPFLGGVMHAYWTQEPGYSLTEAVWRRILYDYAFVRQTWRENKAGRAHEALQYEDVWRQGVILGLGRQLGPFWYPLERE